MTEWLKVHAWKACVRRKPYRGFESLSLRQIKKARERAFLVWRNAQDDNPPGSNPEHGSRKTPYEALTVPGITRMR